MAGWVEPAFRHSVLVVIARFGDLPNTETLANPKTDLATRVYSADGKILGSYYRENRADASYEDLPRYLVNALVATEDVRFYKRWGRFLRFSQSDCLYWQTWRRIDDNSTASKTSFY